MSKADSASPISSIKHDDKTTFFFCLVSFCFLESNA